MSYFIEPKAYSPILDMKQTEHGIKLIKDFFQINLSSELHLRRVTAPLFVLKGTGINDDLNGTEHAVVNGEVLLQVFDFHQNFLFFRHFLHHLPQFLLSSASQSPQLQKHLPLPALTGF